MPTPTNHAEIIAFAVALLASLGLTVPVRHLALRYGMVDKPGPRKVHVNPIPLLGGTAIYLGFVLAILLTRHDVPEQQIVGILAGATLLAIVGFLDDGGLLHHQVKLFIGMPIAAIFLIASGIRAQLFSQFVPGIAGLILDWCLTVVWVVGITAAFSILGAALGFLRWNFNPAKIFMGDGGAMFLGFLMATLGLKIRPDGTQFPHTWLVPVLILGVPIFDTALVSISRARRGLLPFTSPGKDHTAHRLANLGLGHRGAVLVMYFLAAILGGIALVVPNLSPTTVYTIAGILIIAALCAIFLLEGLPYERQVKLHKPSSAS